MSLLKMCVIEEQYKKAPFFEFSVQCWTSHPELICVQNLCERNFSATEIKGKTPAGVTGLGFDQS